MSPLLRTILATSIAQALPIASGQARHIPKGSFDDLAFNMAFGTRQVTPNNIHGHSRQRRGDRIAPDVPETSSFTTLEIKAKPQAGDPIEARWIELPEVGPKRERRTVGVLAATRHARQAFMKKVLKLEDDADTPLLDSQNSASGDIPAVLTVLARPEDGVPHQKSNDGDFVEGTTTAWKSGNERDGKENMRLVARHDALRADPHLNRAQSVYSMYMEAKSMREVKSGEARTKYRKYCAKETHVVPQEEPHKREHDTNFVLFPAMKPEGEKGHLELQRFKLRHGHNGVLLAAAEAQETLVESGLLSAREEYPLVVILSGEAQHETAELKLVGQLLAGKSTPWNRLVFVVHRDEGSIGNVRKVFRRNVRKVLQKVCRTFEHVQERIDAAKVNAAVYEGYNDPDLMNLVWGA